MTFLLCCFFGDTKYIDNNIDDNIISLNKINKKVLKRESKQYDKIINIGNFEKCHYWFTEIVKHVVNEPEQYSNKKELYDFLFKIIDINKTLEFYKKYNTIYNNFNNNNIIEFCKDTSNDDFINDIKKAVKI
jgi:hypothetical protein